MKIALIILALVVAWPLSIEIADVLAQAPVATPDAATQNVLNQIHQVGCNAEAQASATTIAQLQKENAELKARIEKLDPPKSGATKH